MSTAATRRSRSARRQIAGIAVILLLAILVVILLAGCGATPVNQGTVSDASAGAAPAATKAKTAEAPTWGKRYTWPDGLAIEVAAPAPCKPGQYAVSSTQNIQRAVKVTITLINGTDKPFDTSALSFGSDAQFGGRRADQIYDTGGPCGGGPDPTTVLPGKTFTMDVAFAVGPQPGELQLALRPNFRADKAVFVGQA